MIYNYLAKKPAQLAICALVALFSLTGCRQPDDYKAGADDTVYNIIDQKWQDDFGSKVNYKISDVQPSPNDIKIEKAVPICGILTLPQAVAIATAHNRQYQIEKELLYTMALDLKLFRHEFETQFFSGARGGYGKAGSDEGIGGEADFGFDWLLASGARVGTKVGIAWFKVLTGDISGGLASILSATLTQPLLRGSDRNIVMENLTQAERNTVYQIRLFSRFRKTFVVSVISQYYLVLQFFDAVKNAENNYNTILELYAKVEKLANAGRLPLLELERVRQEKLQALDELVLAQKEYKQVLDEFKFWQLSLAANVEFRLDVNELEALSIVSKPAFSKIQEAGRDWLKKNMTIEALEPLEKELELLELIQPDDIDYSRDDQRNHEIHVQLDKTHKQILDELKIASPLPAESVFSEEDVVESALALRLDLANKADAVYDAERKVQVAADGLRGELNLFAGVDATSLAGSSELPGLGALDDDFAADRDRPVPLRRQRDNNPIRRFRDESEIGIDMELPLDRVFEQNIYRRALITLSLRQREYEEMADWVTLEIRQAYRDLTKAAQRHRVQLESLELAQKRFNNTCLLMQYDRANSRRVLDAQADLFRVQNAATESLVGHAVAMLEFYRDVGVLQIRPDGMWEQITE
ncbi:MAG: TolC family protein [Sedimentisphaerales bacterium]|nr:TolC family protein [Sedimentisphaerales bacterium]